MAYYPVFIDTTDRNVLVIGGGHVGLEKTQSLLRAEVPGITVISPDLLPELETLCEEGRIRHIARSYRDGDMTGFDWVMIATMPGAEIVWPSPMKSERSR